MKSKHWWQEKEGFHSGVFEVLNSLDGDIEGRNERWRRYLSILMNKTVSGFKPGEKVSEKEAFKALLGGQQRLTLNPIRSCAAALGARIASQRPRAQFLASTEGPEGYEAKVKAKGMEKVIAAEWARCKVYRQSIKVFFDGFALGFGAMKAFEHEGKIKYERTPPWQLVIDEQAAITTEPRTLYQTFWAPAEVLAAKYPGKKNEAAIESVIGKGGYVANGVKIVTDLVKVVEAWHLPSEEDADDGRHVICIDGQTLNDDFSWKHQRFPFAFFRWEEPLIGWYPQGVVEQEEPVQQQINKMLERIQEAIQIYASAQTWAEEGSIVKGKTTNLTGAINYFKKGAPMPVTIMPASVSSEAFNFTWQLNDQIYKDTGVSQLSAQSIKPAGIESGKALRTLQDTESGRHALTNQSLDDYYVDLAELSTLVIGDIYRETGTYSASYLMKDKIERVDWGKVNLERDQYEIQIFPTSSLPFEPAGRLATVEEMMRAQLVTPEQGKALLNFPDLEQFQSLESAALDDIEMQIGEMLIKGNEQHPEPYMDLENNGLKRMQSALVRARVQNAPEERCQLLLNWIEEAQNILSPPPPSGMDASQANPLPPEVAGAMPAAPPPAGLPPELMPPPNEQPQG